MAAKVKKPLVSILMGSQSDWGVMSHAAQKLDDLGIPWEAQAISAHRATDALMKYLTTTEKRGIEVIIAGAGGAAHLPGVISAKVTLPVLGVPMESASLKGMDSLLSIVQMPAGVPVGTLAIGKPGAINAALLAVSILGVKSAKYRKIYDQFRKDQTKKVLTKRHLKLPVVG